MGLTLWSKKVTSTYKVKSFLLMSSLLMQITGGVVYNGGFNGAEAAYGVMPHYGDGCGMHSQVL